MYRNKFEDNINKGVFFKSYLLYGECDFYINYYLEILISKLANNSSVYTQYFEEYNFDDAKSYLNTSSLFGDINFLVIKSYKKIPNNELTILIDIASKNENSYFILAYYESSNSKSPHKLFIESNKATYMRGFNPNHYEAINFLTNYSKGLKLNIDSNLLSYLFELQSADLTLTISELDKLSLLDENITKNIINKFCSETDLTSIDDFLLKLFQNRDIMSNINKILSDNLDLILFLGRLSDFVVMLIRFKIYFNLNGFIDSNDILGFRLPKHIESLRVSIIKNIDLDTFSEILSITQDLELMLKNATNFNKEAIFFSYLMKIKRLIE